MKAAFFTFGCRLNQCETESLVDAFQKNGFEVMRLEEEADVYLINTCTVTSKSEQKARRIIKKTAEKHPESIVIVTGCYAQVEPDAFSRYGDNVFVVSMDDKDILLDLPVYLATQHSLPQGIKGLVAQWIAGDHGNDDPEKRFRFSPADFNFHSRAFLKIQDGCDKRCAYCRVCLARGPSVSLDPEIVLQRVKELEKRKYAEIVITGINIDSYQHSGLDLSGLVSFLLKNTSQIRFRFSSLDPDTLKGDIPALFNHPRICPHLHLSLQAFCDRTLKRMNRMYSVADIESGLTQLRTIKRRIHISADIIAGFPGETDVDFEESCRKIKEWQISRFHVFPYSKRPDTPAATMPQQVQDREIVRRAGILRNLAAVNFEQYRESCLGDKIELLIEEQADEGERIRYTGTSGNYLTVSCQVEKNRAEWVPGDIMTVRLGSIREGYMTGEIIPE